MSKTRQKPMVEWKDIPWRKLERKVFKLQKRIYKASQRGDVKAVRRLQKTVMRSWSAKCLAIRRVTQDNQGKKTAGVDGIKSLTPKQRLELIPKLKVNRKAKPTRRVWIPKPGTEEKRPLGIPTMYERASQALIKQALEPEWEALFEPNSYGFRPGRSCHDAIGAIYNAINSKAKYALDADIAKCFDRINHKALLEKLNTFPTIRRQVRAWLQAGVMDGEQLFPTSEGTPQGGVISPLLANIALHGLEETINQEFPELKGHQRETWYHQKGTCFKTPQLIRYADDFVVLHENIKVIQRCQQIIAECLKDMGLELKPSKTRITHTLHNQENEAAGFDFLGFNIRQFPVGKYHSGKTQKGTPLGFKTIITPSKKKQKLHLEEIGSNIKAHKNAPQVALIKSLNPIIQGWVNYYRTVVSKRIFTRIFHQTTQKLISWGKSRHPNKSLRWIVSKYWQNKGDKKWGFAGKEKGMSKTMYLTEHQETPIVRHVKVQGERSPYDGNWIYWGTRMGRHPETSTRISNLLKQQQGKCTHCELFFKYGDLLEIDHITPKQEGGHIYSKIQLLHRHCHDTKTANDAVRRKELEEYLNENPF